MDVPRPNARRAYEPHTGDEALRRASRASHHAASLSSRRTITARAAFAAFA
jgi:hypothetical protein